MTTATHDPLAHTRYRVARCCHGIALGLPGIFCEICTPIEAQTKRCSACKGEKRLTEFYLLPNGQRRSQCASCHNKKAARL